jgi:hypothetical protein
MRKDILSLLRFIGVFALLYFVFQKMMIMMHVHMKGWEFILFVIVLALIVEFVIKRWGK